jgi:negative regulator of flagellin synthesis FlgM
LKIDQSTGSATPLPPLKAGSAPAAGRARSASVGQVRQLASPADTSEFDAARVAAIREDIRAGRYQVHPERIADGLLASVQDLLGRGDTP